MGKKKKKTQKEELPWCWYCDREFETEEVLINHQKAKHFKCTLCNKRLFTASGMVTHARTVHKEDLKKVPNALPGRDSVEYEIFGMEGIPEEDLVAHRQQLEEGEGNPAKRQKTDVDPSMAAAAAAAYAAQSGQPYGAPVAYPQYPPQGQAPPYGQQPYGYPQYPPQGPYGGPPPGPYGAPPPQGFPPYGAPPPAWRPGMPPPQGPPPHMGPPRPGAPPGPPFLGPPPGQRPPFQGGPPPLFPAGAPPQQQPPPQGLLPRPAFPAYAPGQPAAMAPPMQGPPPGMQQPPFAAPVSVPAAQPVAAAIAAEVAHAATDVEGGAAGVAAKSTMTPEGLLLYSDEGMSVEEFRASHSRYRHRG